MTSSVALFQPFIQKFALAVIYDGDESPNGVIEFLNDEGETQLSERFDSDSTVIKVVDAFTKLPNGNFQSFSTEVADGEVNINRKYFFFSRQIGDRSTYIISSIQAGLIFLKTFQEQEHKELIEFFEYAIIHIENQKQDLNQEQLELFLNDIEEKIGIVLDSTYLDETEVEFEPSEKTDVDANLTDSGYQSHNSSTPSVDSLSRVATPPLETSDPIKTNAMSDSVAAAFPRAVDRVASSLRNEAYRSEDNDRY